MQRFTLLRELGSGAFGVVHEAMDSVRGERVALKQLQQTDAASILRFKDEFRSLSELSHVNVVRLYELFTDGTEWCFTMELVEGTDLRSYVLIEPDSPLDRSDMPRVDHDTSGASATSRSSSNAHPTDLVPAALLPDGAVQRITSEPLPEWLENERARSQASENPSILQTALLVPVPTPLPSRPLRRTTPPSDLGRLRAALFQLAEALVFLHDSAKLHLDIKPSNVLVSSEGRVVVLDLGLVADSSMVGHVAGVILGTPMYMSPEQAAMRPLSAAADWYAVGVLLFEMLAGTPPFLGSTDAILAQKLSIAAPPIRSLVETLPDDLADLCDELLRTDPELRPQGREIVRRLRTSLGTATSLAPRRTWIAPTTARHVVGRELELSVLAEAQHHAAAGHPSVVCVVGAPGTGKSTLVRRFTEELESRELDVVVLRGRCSAQESLPFHALDPLVDALARLIVSLPPEQVASCIPEGFEQISTVFPVLAGIAPHHRSREPSDDDSVFDSPGSAIVRPLRALLTNVAARMPLVLVLDDAQWGDAQSGEAFADLIDHDEAPPIVLILIGEASTPDELEALAPLQRRFGAADSPRQAAVTTRLWTIRVDPLAHTDAMSLARLLFGASTPAAQLEALVRESAGNPRYLIDLSRHIGSSAPPPLMALGSMIPTTLGSEGAVTHLLQRLSDARISRLSPSARGVLDAVIKAGTIIPIEDALRRAGVSTSASDVVGELRRSQLLTMKGSRIGETAAITHPRMRDAVVSSLRRADELSPASLRIAIPYRDPLGEAAKLLASGDARGALSVLLAAAQTTPSILDREQAGELFQRALAESSASAAHVAVTPTQGAGTDGTDGICGATSAGNEDDAATG